MSKTSFIIFISLLIAPSICSADSIPKSIERYIIREKLAIQADTMNNQWDVYSFADYKYKDDSVTFIKLKQKAELFVDSLLPYLNKESSYTLFINLVNNETPLSNTFTLVCLVKSGEKGFTHVQQIGRRGEVHASEIADNQFIDRELVFKDGIYTNDLFLYNLVDDTLGGCDQDIYNKAKLLFLNFINKVDTKNYTNIHICFISRIGMQVCRSLVYPMWDSKKAIEYHHRLLKWESPAQLVNRGKK